jgi:signal peptidase II
VTQTNREAGNDWKRRAFALGAGVLAVVAFDQVTKSLVASRMTLGESVSVIPGLVDFTLVRNTGMAFGLFSGADVPFKSALVTVASLLALAAVTFYAMRSPAWDFSAGTGFALILGGAVGNIIDRVRLGYVIDFVDVFVRDSHWPAFNVADAAISVGVGLLLLDSVSRREPAREREVVVEAGRRNS